MRHEPSRCVGFHGPAADQGLSARRPGYPHALEVAAADAKVYVDKVLAHADSRCSGPVPAPDVVDSAIQVLGGLLVKYMLILRGVDLELTPVPRFNWAAVFREPWLPG